MAKANVFKIKYEIKANRDYPNWECYAIGEDQKDVMYHLENKIKAPIVIHEITHLSRVDTVSDRVKNLLVPQHQQTKKEVKCEKCNKTFPSEHALKIHKTKVHNEE